MKNERSSEMKELKRLSEQMSGRKSKRNDDDDRRRRSLIQNQRFRS